MYRYTIHGCRRRFLPRWALELSSVSAESEGFDSPPRHEEKQSLGSLRFVVLDSRNGPIVPNCPQGFPALSPTGAVLIAHGVSDVQATPMLRGVRQ